jgi:pyruvate/2-oxoglutarate dehydrogenase complex dihydrolipoamide acyltransferase (E2) component
MPVPFIMPKFDMDQEKATIISWSKKEGDLVKIIGTHGRSNDSSKE